MTTVKISDILNRAADEYLAPNLYLAYSPEYNYDGTFSCDAVYDAIQELPISDDLPLIGFIFDFLESLGLQKASTNYCAFEEFEEGEERQQVRYAWLKFAAMIAEEENLEYNL